MRRWGRVPICKTSRPDHELGIQTHTTLLRKERKEVIWWAEEIKKRGIVEEAEWRDQSPEERRVLATLWFEGELRNKLVLGARSCWQHFQSKLINGVDE
jgi:hypothetical protein